jgi:hypothetical protein
MLSLTHPSKNLTEAIPDGKQFKLHSTKPRNTLKRCYSQLSVTGCGIGIVVTDQGLSMAVSKHHVAPIQSGYRYLKVWLADHKSEPH